MTCTKHIYDKAIISCKRMATEAGLIQIFGARAVLGFCFVFMLFTVYSTFQNFRNKKKLCSVKFCEFRFLPKFHEMFPFSTSRKTEALESSGFTSAGLTWLSHLIILHVPCVLVPSCYHNLSWAPWASSGWKCLRVTNSTFYLQLCMFKALLFWFESNI